VIYAYHGTAALETHCHIGNMHFTFQTGLHTVYLTGSVSFWWRSGNITGRINEVALRRARLVLGWVTVFGG